jgi:large conductance mechanosensitive channel
MLSEFRKFILRGNVVDLAVGIVIGAAFGAVVNGLVKDIVTPVIAAIGGKPDFAGLSFTIHGSVFRYGHFFNTIVSFLLISAAVFFIVVVPVNKLMEQFGLGVTEEDEPTRDCPECLSKIPLAATRCAHCTTTVPPATPEIATT